MASGKVANSLRRQAACSRRRALTLIELLVVIAIIALAMSIILPALAGMRGSVRSLVCSSGLKSIAMEFSLFASPEPSVSRGQSESLGPKRFRITDFQDSLYNMDEFWDLGQQPAGEVAGEAELMLCPAGPPQLIKRHGIPADVLIAFEHPEHVSLAMNMRLYRAEIEFSGQIVLSQNWNTHVRSAILDRPYVPLVLDVDGAEAVRLGHEPVYTAPPVGSAVGPYASGSYWTPSGRHGGRTNVAFVGGHVLSSTDPAAESWDWEYQADTE